MIDYGKKNILGVLINAVDYEAAMDAICRAAKERRGMAVSALAVHGVMTGALNPEHKFRLNHFDLVVPDGQPVRWALNRIYAVRLPDRVYGPNLTLGVCSRAEKEGLSVSFYGSTEEILSALKKACGLRFPKLRIAGMEPSKFRQLTPEEKEDVIRKIRSSQADILFVGLGCPRQEVWAYEFRDALSMPILAVGAAFPFIAGKVRQAPRWMQDHALEWLFRTWVEPRLWKRHLLLDPAYLFLIAIQMLGIKQFSQDGQEPVSELLFG